MMKTTCDGTVELLPWWLNGTLEEAEARRVADHLAECTACSDELAATREALAMHALHLPVETLLDRAEGEGASSERVEGEGTLSRRAVDEHLAHCPSCREELSLLRASRAAIEADPVAPQATVEAFTPRPGGFRRRLDRRSLALAASLVLFAVTAGGWFLSGRLAEERGDRVTELESRLLVLSEEAAAVGAPEADATPRHEAEVALEAEAVRLAERIRQLEREVEMARRVVRPRERLAEAVGVGPTFSWRLSDPVLRGGGTSAREEGVVVPAGADDVSLFVEDVGEGPLRLEVEDVSGRRLLVRDDLRPFEHPLLGRHLTITVPVADLPDGPLRLRLFDGDEEVGSLLLRAGR